jgi:hypothetical protein
MRRNPRRTCRTFPRSQGRTAVSYLDPVEVLEPVGASGLQMHLSPSQSKCLYLDFGTIP